MGDEPEEESVSVSSKFEFHSKLWECPDQIGERSLIKTMVGEMEKKCI